MNQALLVFLTALARPVSNEDGILHKSFVGKFIGGVVKRIPVFGGIAETAFELGGALFDGGAGTKGCPPGFIPTPTGCVPRGSPDLRTTGPLTRTLRERFGGRETRPPPRPPPRDIGVPGDTMAATARANGVTRPPVPTLAVTGQFGAGFEPSLISTEMLECPPGTILGKDEVCYNRRDLRNNERKWPRGRRPLLTGGEMRAISTAASAAKRLQKKQQQLRSLGLLKPLPKAKAPKMLAPGHHAHIAHDGQSQH